MPPHPSPLERDVNNASSLPETPSEAVSRLAAEIERLEDEETVINCEMSELLRRGIEMRREGASDQDVSEINDQLAVLQARRRALPSPLQMQLLRQQHASAEHGWTPLPDGSYVKELPGGSMLGCYGGVSEWEEEDGTVYRETAEDCRRRAERHRQHVRTFKAGLAEARMATARRQTLNIPALRPRTACPRRPRMRTAARRAAGVRSGQDPGDPDLADEPPWRPPPRRLLDRLSPRCHPWAPRELPLGLGWRTGQLRCLWRERLEASS